MSCSVSNFQRFDISSFIFIYEDTGTGIQIQVQIQVGLHASEYLGQVLISRSVGQNRGHTVCVCCLASTFECFGL